MKKIFYILSAAMLFFVSCSSPSPEEQAKKIMEEFTKKNLVKPDSYEFVDVKFDSCFFGSQISPEVFQFVIELSQLYSDYNELKDKAQIAETHLAIYAPSPYGYDSALDKLQRKKYQEELDKANMKKEDNKVKILQLYKDNTNLIKAFANGGEEFTGFYGILQYRAETNGGDKRNNEALFFFDKNMTNVIDAYNGDEFRDLSILEDINYEFAAELADIFSQQ